MKNVSPLARLRVSHANQPTSAFTEKSASFLLTVIKRFYEFAALE